MADSMPSAVYKINSVKKRLKNNSLFIVFAFLFLSKADAKIVLPNMFANNMVMQQQSKAAIWGNGLASSIIKLNTSWDKKNYQIKSDKNGNWKIEINTPKAGGPFNITIKDTGTLVIENVMIGEVWFCSGQSNMEMPVRGFKNQPVLNSNEILADADNFSLRLFETKKNGSKTPLVNIDGQWKLSNSESASSFSAVAYMYGSLLQKKLKVPVGIIVSSVGGTRIQSWMDYQTLMSMPDSLNYLKDFNKIDTAKDKNKCATALYNAMIAPFVGYGIKGFLWYQGESNRHEPKVYQKLFPAMVQSWRKAWNQKDSLPFYYVQIAPYESKDSTKSVKGLREAQMKALKEIPNSAMAVTMDIGEENRIHPAHKKEVSERLLYCALVNTYGYKGLAFSGPLYKAMEIKNNKISIAFDFANNGLTTFGNDFINFEISGQDKVFYPAKAKIEDDKTISVWSEQVQNPIAVRYAYKEYAKGELYNIEGLPASSFRTDDW
jgi:sialate O-acetylesterase